MRTAPRFTARQTRRIVARGEKGPGIRHPCVHVMCTARGRTTLLQHSSISLRHGKLVVIYLLKFVFFSYTVEYTYNCIAVKMFLVPT